MRNSLLKRWQRTAGALGMVLTAGLSLRLHAQTTVSGATGGSPENPWILAAAYTQAWDNNITLSATPQGDTSSQVALNLGGHWQGPRWNFSALYTPEGVTYAHHRALSYFAQTYDQSLTYATGPESSLSWSVSAAMYPQRGGLPGGAINGGLGAALTAGQGLGVGSDLTDGTTTLNWQQKVSARSTWSAGVNFGLNAFTPDRQLLIETGRQTPLEAADHSNMLGGTVGWNHNVNASLTLGVSAMDNRVRYTRTNARLNYSDVEATMGETLGTWQLRLGAGPSWTQNLESSSFTERGLGYAANASLTKQFGLSESGIQWEHTLQAGYLPGGVAHDLFGAQYGTQWATDWQASVSAGYSRQGVAQGAVVNTQYASAGVSWHPSPDWSLQGGGSFVREPFSLLGEGAGSLRRESVFVSLRFAPGGTR
ncbi:MAG: hypothetical protein ACRD04_13975 [Terriglobales bacterium]